MKKDKKRSFEWLRWTAVVVLLFVLVFLIFNQQIKSYLVGSYKPEITRQTVQSNQKKKATYDFQSVKDLNLQTAAKARANKQSINTIGAITVPAINMTIPIANGVDNTTLALAAGTLRPDMKMGEGNYALAGHNMAHGSKILFSPLYYHAKVGQMIYITNMDRVYEYKIYQREFIAATRVDVVDNTPEKIITLITCDATGANRLMIRGKFVKSEPFTKAPQNVQKNFSEKYTTGR